MLSLFFFLSFLGETSASSLKGDVKFGYGHYLEDNALELRQYRIAFDGDILPESLISIPIDIDLGYKKLGEIKDWREYDLNLELCPQFNLKVGSKVDPAVVPFLNLGPSFSFIDGGYKDEDGNLENNRNSIAGGLKVGGGLLVSIKSISLTGEAKFRYLFGYTKHSWSYYSYYGRWDEDEDEQGWRRREFAVSGSGELEITKGIFLKGEAELLKESSKTTSFSFDGEEYEGDDDWSDWSDGILFLYLGGGVKF